MQYLGTIVVVQNASTNNTTTASSFTIQPTWLRLLIVTPTASGVTFNIAVGAGSTFAATANDFGVPEQTSTQVTCPVPPPAAGTVLAIYGISGGGNVKVYGLWGQAQS